MRRIWVLASLALLCFVPSGGPQQTPEKDISRQVSPDAIGTLLAAKTVLVRGGKSRVVQTGKNTLLVYPTDKAEAALKKALLKWGRFKVVTDAAQADLIFEISEVVDRDGEHLTILPGSSKSAGSGTPLWEAEEVRPTFGFSRSPTGKLVEHFQKDLEAFEKSTSPAAAR